jgi:hypothetical protein
MPQGGGKVSHGNPAGHVRGIAPRRVAFPMICGQQFAEVTAQMRVFFAQESQREPTFATEGDQKLPIPAVAFQQGAPPPCQTL